MKRILFATALSVVAATSAFAGMANNTLPATTQYEIRLYVPHANLDNLSNAQVAQINGFFVNSENLQSGNNPAGALQVILNQK